MLDLESAEPSAPAAHAGSGPRTISLREYGTANAESLSSGELGVLDKRFHEFLTVTHDWRTGSYALAASHFVGVIQIGDLRLRIEPKAPATNFFFMLTFANELQVDWNAITELNNVDDILELIVRTFVDQVELVLRRGIYRTYREEEDARPFLRGRLLLAQQLRQSLNAPGRFAQRLHEYTSDVTENRILLWTLQRLERMPWRDPLLNRRMRRLAAGLDEVALAPITQADFDALVYTRLNEGYRNPHRLARLLLQMRSIEGVEGKHHFSGWLLDMNRLFEQFVGVYLQEYARRTPACGLTVDLQNELELGVDHSVWVRPDIIIRNGAQACAVMDTKHKVLAAQPEEADRRQLLEYTVNLHLHAGYLIYSSHDPAKTFAPLRTYGGGWPFALHSVVWSLDGSLVEFQARSATIAERLIGQQTPSAGSGVSGTSSASATAA